MKKIVGILGVMLTLFSISFSLKTVNRIDNFNGFSSLIELRLASADLGEAGGQNQCYTKDPSKFNCSQTIIQEVATDYQAGQGETVKLGSEISGGLDSNTGVYKANFQTTVSGDYEAHQSNSSNKQKKYLVKSSSTFMGNGWTCIPEGNDDCTPYNPCNTIFP